MFLAKKGEQMSMFRVPFSSTYCTHNWFLMKLMLARDFQTNFLSPFAPFSVIIVTSFPFYSVTKNDQLVQEKRMIKNDI